MARIFVAEIKQVDGIFINGESMAHVITGSGRADLNGVEVVASNYGHTKNLEYFISSQILFAISTVDIFDLMIEMPQELRQINKADELIKTPGFKAVFAHNPGKSITIYDKNGIHDIVRPDQFYHFNDERNIKLML